MIPRPARALSVWGDCAHHRLLIVTHRPSKELAGDLVFYNFKRPKRQGSVFQWFSHALNVHERLSIYLHRLSMAWGKNPYLSDS